MQTGAYLHGLSASSDSCVMQRQTKVFCLADLQFDSKCWSMWFKSSVDVNLCAGSGVSEL